MVVQVIAVGARAAAGRAAGTQAAGGAARGQAASQPRRAAGPWDRARNSRSIKEVPGSSPEEHEESLESSQAPSSQIRYRAKGSGQIKNTARTSPRRRISRTVAGLMVGTAALVDSGQFVLNLIPVLGQFMGLMMSFIAFIGFVLWFALMGVNFIAGRRAGMKMMAAFGTTIVELVPLVQALPAMSMGVAITIIASWLEDTADKEDALRKSKALAQISNTRNEEQRAKIERMRARLAGRESQSLPT